MWLHKILGYESTTSFTYGYGLPGLFNCVFFSIYVYNQHKVVICMLSHSVNKIYLDQFVLGSAISIDSKANTGTTFTIKFH